MQSGRTEAVRVGQTAVIYLSISSSSSVVVLIKEEEEDERRRRIDREVF